LVSAAITRFLRWSMGACGLIAAGGASMSIPSRLRTNDATDSPQKKRFGLWIEALLSFSGEALRQ
jgi:hypothetical protein